jgi:hypothetical protein
MHWSYECGSGLGREDDALATVRHQPAPLPWTTTSRSRQLVRRVFNLFSRRHVSRPRFCFSRTTLHSERLGFMGLVFPAQKRTWVSFAMRLVSVVRFHIILDALTH